MSHDGSSATMVAGVGKYDAIRDRWPTLSIIDMIHALVATGLEEERIS
jgi:hypothetical protein